MDLPDLNADEPSTTQIVRGQNRTSSTKVALLAGSLQPSLHPLPVLQADSFAQIA